jgi:23S rRNA pseudouridine2605 synthase
MMVSGRKVGLARVLSKLGYCSRSRAFELVRAGEVRVNGVVRRDAEFPVRMELDRIEVGGEVVRSAQPVYLMMNKPRGVVTTAADEKGRRTVYELLPEGTPWVGPVGRLDKASEGLLLLTNDSELAARVTEPESHVEKTYHVQVTTSEPEKVVEAMLAGRVSDGEMLRVKNASVLRRGDKNAWLEVVLDEGRNRQIRRLLETVGVEVLRLVRVSIGPLKLGELPKGEVRSLTEEEIDRVMS